MVYAEFLIIIRVDPWKSEQEIQALVARMTEEYVGPCKCVYQRGPWWASLPAQARRGHFCQRAPVLTLGEKERGSAGETEEKGRREGVCKNETKTVDGEARARPDEK